MLTQRDAGVNDGLCGQKAWVEAWAGDIESVGLSTLAVPLLEFVRSFSVLVSHAMLLVQPLLIGIVDDSVLQRVMVFLDAPELQEQLMSCLKGKES